MQLSTNFKFAFLCTPKCASTSIEAAISKYCNINFSNHTKIKHINARDFNEFILSFHNKVLPKAAILSFCVIRHPIERLESWYRYRQKDELRNPAHPRHKAYTGNLTFNEFIEGVVEQRRESPYSAIISQADFVRLDDYSVGLDYIYTIEQLDKVSKLISQRVGKKVSFLKLNQTVGENRLELDEGLRARLVEFLSLDFRLYNFVSSNGGYDKSKDRNSLMLK